jgi:NAD(P)-dependent dehydrogenase (short-subunit alcohol dehydrogenase family)
MTTLAGKTAIVTGGGRGVGRGIALALASEGANVAVCGRSEPPLHEVCEAIAQRGPRASAIVCDVKEPDHLSSLVEQVVRTFGGVDILVNNAMEIPNGTLLDTSDEAIDAAWRSSPLAALRLMRLCHPYLRGGGSVVNISSGAAVAPALPQRGVYGMTKAALNAISRAAATEWATEQIRVNTIMPFARTEALDVYMQTEPEHSSRVIANIPLGRLGDPEHDIGRVVTWLVGPDASYVTGVTIPVDGGLAYIR